MEITAQLAGQLRLLRVGCPDTEALAKTLTLLAADVSMAVASWLSVSLHVGHLGAQVTASSARGGGPAPPVLASLSVPLGDERLGDFLLLRAAEPGAFTVLAGELRSLLGPSWPALEVDTHMNAADDVTGRSLADLSTVNQAVGALIERGFPPTAARLELSRRASEAGIDEASAGWLLLASLAGRASGR